MNHWNEDLFDETKIKQAMTKGKRKSIISMISISIIVLMICTGINFAVYFYFSERTFNQLDAYTRLSTPNGYISETTESIGILGGNRQYKIVKDIGHKAIMMEQKQASFGLLPLPTISRGFGGSIGVSGEDWQVTYKENGWKDLQFFHPTVSYEKYVNDKKTIQSMDEHSLYEVAFSFDKPYPVKKLPIPNLPRLSWLWINTYADQDIKNFQSETNQFDWTSNFIDERDALGFTVNGPYDFISTIADEYADFLSLLQKSFDQRHHLAYEHLKNTDVEDIEVLGLVLYGTKEELEPLFDHPNIKAASIGGMIENY